MEIANENIWSRILPFSSLKLFPLFLSQIPCSRALLFLIFLALFFSLTNPHFISSNCWHSSFDSTFDIYWFVTVSHCIDFNHKFVRLENSYKLWNLFSSKVPNIFVQAVFSFEFCFFGHINACDIEYINSYRKAKFIGN